MVSRRFFNGGLLACLCARWSAALRLANASMVVAACAGTAVDKPLPTQVDPPPGVDAHVHISVDFDSDVGILRTLIIVSGHAATNSTIAEVTVDYNSDGITQPDERFADLPQPRTVEFENEANTDLQRWIVASLTTSVGRMVRDSVLLTIRAYYRVSGTILTIDSVSGRLGPPACCATITAGGAFAFTAADGKYSVKAKRPIDTIVIAQSGYQTYSTFAHWTIDPDTTRATFALIPSAIIDEFNCYLRIWHDGRPGQAPSNYGDAALTRWVVQPAFVIASAGFDSAEVELFKLFLMSGWIEQFTDGRFKGPLASAQIQVVDSAPPDSTLRGKLLIKKDYYISNAGPVVFDRDSGSTLGSVLRMTGIDGVPPFGQVVVHEMGHATGLFHPRGSAEVLTSWMGMGDAFTPALLRALRINYGKLRPAGSRFPDNDPSPSGPFPPYRRRWTYPITSTCWE